VLGLFTENRRLQITAGSVGGDNDGQKTLKNHDGSLSFVYLLPHLSTLLYEQHVATASMGLKQSVRAVHLFILCLFNVAINCSDKSGRGLI
jgi:hypothetical protein